MLNPNELLLVKQIFEQKRWETIPFFSDDDASFFAAVCRFLEGVTGNERELLISILKKYEYIVDYYSYASSISRKLKDLIGENDKCYFFPVEEGGGVIKSGHTFCYDLSAFFSKQKYKNVIFADSPFSNKVKISEEAKYVLVDDFIGTGDQIYNVYEKLRAKGIDPRQTFCVCIRMLKKAKSRLSYVGLSVVCDDSAPTAISSGYAIGDFSLEKALDLYLKMESRVKVPNGFSLGYGRAEALVTMKKTPNNTLPIFWINTGIGGGEWPAPFRRP